MHHWLLEWTNSSNRRFNLASSPPPSSPTWPLWIEMKPLGFALPTGCATRCSLSRIGTGPAINELPFSVLELCPRRYQQADKKDETAVGASDAILLARCNLVAQSVGPH